MASDPEFRPLLSPWHRLADDGERLVLEHGGQAIVLEGRAVQALLPALLPLLDGTSTVVEIVAALGEHASVAVERALDLLREHGLVTEGPPLAETLPSPFAAAALFHAAGDPEALSPGVARRRLAEAQVGIVGGGAAAAEVGRCLRLSGVRSVCRTDWTIAPRPDALTVVAPSPTELERLPTWNEAALAAGAPWLQILPGNGSFAAVGPLYLPGETCCYACFQRRRAANVAYPEVFEVLERATGGAPDPPAVATAVAGLATLSCLRWLVSRDPTAAGCLHALEMSDGLAVTRHAVYRLPRCPACSTATGALPLPWAEAS